MKAQYDHLLMSSFKEWFQHSLLDKGQAFSNTSGSLYPSSAGYSKDVFAAPYQQWVYDSSVSGATVPSGVYSNGTYVAKGSNGLKIDHKRGRAIFDENSQTGSGITASYSYKEFNIYTSSKPEEKLLFETNFAKTSPVTGLPPRSIVAPCIFLKQFDSFNEGYALGGEDQTQNTIRSIVFSKSEYQSAAVKSLFRDQNKKVFPLLSQSETPLDEYGDLKTSWNYNDVMSNANQSQLVYVDDVVASRIENDFLSERHPELYVSIIEFKLKKPRFPRQ